jgi:TonB family protein
MEFQAAFETDPDNAGLLTGMGFCYAALKDTGQALSYFSNALFDTATQPEASLAMAAIYDAQNRTELAELMLTRAINAAPARIELWSALEQFYANRNYNDAAIACLSIEAELGVEECRARLEKMGIQPDAVDRSGLRWLKAQPVRPDPDAAVPTDGVPPDIMPYPIETYISEYPPDCRFDAVEGTVWVAVLISRTGIVLDAKIAKTDAVRLNTPALKAAKKYRFTPAIRRGTPVKEWAYLPFRYDVKR